MASSTPRHRIALVVLAAAASAVLVPAAAQAAPVGGTSSAAVAAPAAPFAGYGVCNGRIVGLFTKPDPASTPAGFCTQGDQLVVTQQAHGTPYTYGGVTSDKWSYVLDLRYLKQGSRVQGWIPDYFVKYTVPTP